MRVGGENGQAFTFYTTIPALSDFSQIPEIPSLTDSGNELKELTGVLKCTVQGPRASSGPMPCSAKKLI